MEIFLLKEQEAIGSLNNLIGIKIPILSDLTVINTLFKQYEMNPKVNKLLLAADELLIFYRHYSGSRCSRCAIDK